MKFYTDFLHQLNFLSDRPLVDMKNANGFFNKTQNKE